MAEQLLCFAQGLAVRRRGEWEIHDLVNRHGFHLEDDTFDWHPEDLGFGELLEMIFEQCRRVETITVSRTRSTCSTGPLRCGGLGDPPDLERLDASGMVICPFL
jgi:hypothetical protein